MRTPDVAWRRNLAGGLDVIHPYGGWYNDNVGARQVIWSAHQYTFSTLVDATGAELDLVIQGACQCCLPANSYWNITSSTTTEARLSEQEGEDYNQHNQHN